MPFIYLVLFNFSKTFDIINHKVLLFIFHYLEMENAVIYLLNFLGGRVQSLMPQDVVSGEVSGPQGSSISLLLFLRHLCKILDQIKHCTL